MKKQRKMYTRPMKLWNKERIETERKILNEFGLRRKRELWRAEALLRKFRRIVRGLAAKKDKEKEKVLIKKLIGLGVLNEGAGLDDVLGLTVNDVLDRRLETIVFKKGLTNTPKQARQFIVHGHVAIGGRKVIYPSYIVPRDEEDKIQVNVISERKKMVVVSDGTQEG